MNQWGQHRDISMLGFRSGYKSFTNLPFHVFPTGLPSFSDSKIFTPDLLEVNQKLEQCAEDCIAKLLKSLAVRNQDRSSRPLDMTKNLREQSVSRFVAFKKGMTRGLIRMATQKFLLKMKGYLLSTAALNEFQSQDGFFIRESNSLWWTSFRNFVGWWRMPLWPVWVLFWTVFWSLSYDVSSEHYLPFFALLLVGVETSCRFFWAVWWLRIGQPSQRSQC